MEKLNITPYEKYLNFGPESLTDVELLSIIIRNGTKEFDAIQIADMILCSHDKRGRIIGLMNLSVDELTNYPGIGKIKAMCIGCVLELGKRIHKQSKEKRISFNKPGDIADCYMEQLRHQKQEIVLLLLIDTKGSLIKEIVLTKGTYKSSLVSVRDIFVQALLFESSGIVLLHNHPSGISAPSDEDFIITSKIKHAGDLIEIGLIDHIIIGDNNFYSFKNNGYI